MTKSTRKPSVRKPSKPYEDFPLFPHNSGRWAKKILGKIHFFGRWGRVKAGKLERIEGDGWRDARDLYQQQRDDLYAGREPVDPDSHRCTIADLCNSFRASREHAVQAGELTRRSLNDYLRTIDRIIGVFGKRRQVETLRPDDFAQLKTDITLTYRTPEGLGNEVNRCRVVFNHATKNYLVDRVHFGDQFSRPRRDVIRRARAHNRLEKGVMAFTAAEIKAILQCSGVVTRAMVLLGLNCGLDNAGIGQMKLGALDLDREWLDYPRLKTGAPRECPLWRETVEAIRAAVEARPKAKPGCEGYVFLTRCGTPWHKDDNRSPLSQEFRKLMEKAGVYRTGRGFRALRHTFETVASGSRDQIAVDHIMGHEAGSMAATYRERIERDRLQAVVDHVHDWLWPPKPKGKRGAAKQNSSKGKQATKKPSPDRNRR